MLASWFERQWTRYSVWQLVLQPLAVLFAALSAMRRLLYRSGVLRVQRLPVPVVVVGNISVGGTGKTPLVLWLAQQLRARGARPGIISRGYGASSAEPRAVAPDDDPAVAGDEALLLVQRSASPVWIGADRAAAGRGLLAAQPDCDVIIADDGLQHYRLGRDAEIAVVDATRGFGNGCLLPAGPLRERVQRLESVDAVVANAGALHLGLRVPVFRMQLVGDSARPLLGGEDVPLTNWRGQRVHAVAAIGNPQRFFDDLRAFGLEVVEHAFADHHVFEPQQLVFTDGAPVLMTEKDAVKCRRFAKANWYVRPVHAEVDAGLADRIFERVRQRHGSETT